MMTSDELAGCRILVVEDEPIIAHEIALNIEDAGGEVIGPASTLARALETIVGATGLTAAVLDVRLRADDVAPAARALSQRGVPFVFHTGHGDSSILAEWPRAVIVNKPSPPEALVAALSTVIRRDKT